jgi:glutaredoxin
MAMIILYTLRDWVTSQRARRDLAEAGVEFEERVIDDNAAWWEEAAALSATVPVLVRGDQVEVGWKGESGWFIQ